MEDHGDPWLQECVCKCLWQPVFRDVSPILDPNFKLMPVFDEVHHLIVSFSCCSASAYPWPQIWSPLAPKIQNGISQNSDFWFHKSVCDVMDYMVQGHYHPRALMTVFELKTLHLAPCEAQLVPHTWTLKLRSIQTLLGPRNEFYCTMMRPAMTCGYMYWSNITYDHFKVCVLEVYVGVCL